MTPPWGGSGLRPSPLGGGVEWGGMPGWGEADRASDRPSRTHACTVLYRYSAGRGVMTNVDGVRTIGVSFFGTDRGLSGCALFIMGLYVLPYKDGILGRVSVRCGLPAAGFGVFRGSLRSGRTRRPSLRAGQCSQSRQQRGVTYEGMIVHIYMHVR